MCSGTFAQSYSVSKSGTKKEPKPKLFGPDIFRWGRELPREGVGAKKFGMSLETREIKFFWRDIPGFCRDIPGCPQSLKNKSLCSILQAVSNRRFVNKRFSQLNDERCWHVRERSPSKCGRPFCRFPHKIKCFANR